MSHGDFAALGFVDRSGSDCENGCDARVRIDLLRCSDIILSNHSLTIKFPPV